MTSHRKQVSVIEVGGLDHILVQLLFGRRFWLFLFTGTHGNHVTFKAEIIQSEARDTKAMVGAVFYLVSASFFSSISYFPLSLLSPSLSPYGATHKKTLKHLLCCIPY